jgi:dTDP-4-dehydrorhamnose reductase
MDSPTYSLDAAAAVVAMIVEKAPWGVFHIANEGWISYYEFVVKLRLLLGLENEIVRCKEQDFASPCYKPLRTGLRSVKRRPLRAMDLALREYVEMEMTRKHSPASDKESCDVA